MSQNIPLGSFLYVSVCVCVCVLNGLWDAQYDWIMRLLISNPQSMIAKFLYSAAYCYQLLSTPPFPPVLVNFWIIQFPPPPITTPSVLVNIASLLSLYQLIPKSSHSVVLLPLSISQPLPLVSVHRVECLLNPQFHASFLHPFSIVINWWSLHIKCFPTYLPPRVIFLSPVMLLCLVSARVNLFSGEGNGTRRLHSLSVAHPITCPPGTGKGK